MNPVPFSLGALAALLVLAHPGECQKRKDKEEAWKRDPYTAGDAKRMARAGYVSPGPFLWGDDHGSADIDKMMPEAKILWLETRHFRIGCSLDILPVPKDSKPKRRMIRELKDLKRVLPKVKPTTRKLDRWLRLHLYAHRLERLYAECQAILQVTDEAFPKKNLGPLPLKRGPDFMGTGPIMGMNDKFLVLLLKKPSNLSRYATKCGLPTATEPEPVVHNFFDRGSMMFATSPAVVAHPKDPDHYLDVHLQFGVAAMILRAYRYYSHKLPPWVEEGFCNSILISRDPEDFQFSGMQNWDKNRSYPGRWPVLARKLAKNGFALPSKKIARYATPHQMTFNDQVCSWSRVDFLRQQDGGKKFARFVHLLAAPMPAEPGKSPEFQTILDAQDAALKATFGWDWDQLDAEWVRYTQKRYPRK